MLELEQITLLTRMINVLEPHIEQIHLVIGYREDLIIEHCERYHKKIVLVRNPDYRSTNTAHSFQLGARHLEGKTVFLDGDLIIDPYSFDRFINYAANSEMLIGLCNPGSENAIFAEAENKSGKLIVNAFTDKKQTSYEWANIFVGPSKSMENIKSFVFEGLSKLLPLPGCILKSVEIDTFSDFEKAKIFLKTNKIL